MSTVEVSGVDSQAAAARATPPLTRWMQRTRRLPAALRLGIAIYIAALSLAAAGALLMVDPNEQDLTNALAKPWSPGHPLGTDALGRDVLAWIAASVTTSLTIAVSVVAISVVSGTLVGVVAGHAGGMLDATLMRLVDLQLAVPPLLLFIAATSTLGHSMMTLILLISVVSWVPYARVVRTHVLVERRRASVAAARLAGVSRSRLLAVHLLPSAATSILVLASLQLGFVLLWEAGLSFVGLGISPPTASLGFLIAQGKQSLQEAWWVVVFPGAMLAALLFAANIVGDGLQELFGVDVEVLER